MTAMRLSEIYSSAELSDETELLWHHVPEDAQDVLFEVSEIEPGALVRLVCSDGVTTVLEAFDLFADPDQRQLVKDATAAFAAERVVVVDGMTLIDGYHHVVAAARIGRPVRALDLADPRPAPGGPEL